MSKVNKSGIVCFICNGEHRPRDCEHWETSKDITIARLKKMPDNMRMMIG